MMVPPVDYLCKKFRQWSLIPCTVGEWYSRYTSDSSDSWVGSVAQAAPFSSIDFPFAFKVKSSLDFYSAQASRMHVAAQPSSCLASSVGRAATGCLLHMKFPKPKHSVDSTRMSLLIGDFTRRK